MIFHLFNKSLLFIIIFFLLTFDFINFACIYHFFIINYLCGLLVGNG